MTHHIILRADDFEPDKNDESKPSGQWIEYIRYIKKMKICTAVGLIGRHLIETEFIDYIDTIKEEIHLEFFNHGFHHAKGEMMTNEKTQRKLIIKTMTLARRLFGIDLKVFGPPFHQWNRETVHALSKIPMIKVVMGYGLKGIDKLILNNPATPQIENPVHIPNYFKFPKTFDKKEKLTVIQLHPGSWSGKDLNHVKCCIEWLLKDKNNRFITPLDYWELVRK